MWQWSDVASERLTVLLASSVGMSEHLFGDAASHYCINDGAEH
jgi:hypothetical protein